MHAVHLTWRSPQVLIASVDGRDLGLVGSEGIEGDVHYTISSQLMTRWADGAPLDPVERDSILPDVVAAARERGWNFVIELCRGVGVLAAMALIFWLAMRPIRLEITETEVRAREGSARAAVSTSSPPKPGVPGH